MFQRLLFFSLFIFLPIAILRAGPYAPAAGQPGSTAISKDDPRFVEWATGISVARGLQEIDKPDLGYASYGSPSDAFGPAQGSNTTGVVSLGDGGAATITFAQPIANGPGPDFAVFENGISDTYLELAFVEVSSDDKNYFRFPSVSLTQTNTQVGGFGTLDPTNLYDLAGNYRVGYGTPFDLSELAETPGLNVNAVTQVRVVDVVGCIETSYCTYDSQGHKINDPWSTPFTSSGFDLGGVGVIHAVPEPGTLILLAIGSVCAIAVCRRRAPRLVGRDQPASAVV